MKTRTTWRLVIAVVVATGVIATPISASAGENSGASSYAEGRFLSGTVAGINLDDIVHLASAHASNDGSAPMQVVRNPLSATVLRSLTVASTPVSITGLNGASLGVLGQYARANGNGESFASSGLIGNNGAISVNPGSGNAATVHLTPLLGSAFTRSIANLSLSVQAIAAQAEAKLNTYDGDYALAGLKLNFELPVVKGLPGATRNALAPVEHALNSLAGPTGTIAHALDGLLRQQNSSLGILGNAATVSVDIDANLGEVVSQLISATLSDAALSINLETGTVSVNLAKLPSTKNLNGLAPGTELLSSAVVSDIVSGLQRLLRNHLNGIEAALHDALENAHITVRAQLSLLDSVKTGDRTVETVTTVTHIVDKVTGEVLGILDPTTGLVTSLVPGLSGSDLLKSLNGVLGGLLANLLGLGNGVVTRTVNEVTTTLEPVFSLLETKVDVGISGTVEQFNSGIGVAANVDLVVLGTTVNLDAILFINSIDALFDSTLLGTNSVASKAIDGLSSTVLGPVLSVVSGNGSSSVGSLLGEVLSVKANVKKETSSPDGGEYFTQTALQVSVLGNTATLKLANATVGPNAAVDGGGDGPGDDGDDPGPGDDGSNDGPATTPTSDGGGFLAHSGAWLSLMAILSALALLVAGAYLAIRNRIGRPAKESDPVQELIV